MKNYKLRFDFFVPYLNLNIEYNGIQHYKPVRFGGISFERAKYNLTQQKVRDKVKRDFCSKNNLYLLEISYNRIKNINKIIKDYIDVISHTER